MRHHCRTEDAGRQQNALCPPKLRHNGVIGYIRPLRSIKECFDQIAESNHADQGGNDCLHRPEAVTLQSQDDERHNGGQDAAPEQWNAEEKLEADGRAYKLGQVSRHSHDLRQDPHSPDHGLWEALTTHLREVEAGGNT